MNRKEIAKAFKEAKNYLSPTLRDQWLKHEFICHALNEAHKQGKISLRSAADAEEVIMDRVGDDALTACNWLRDAIGEKAVDEAMRQNPNALQEWRHRWLDSLIEEFSK